MTAGQRAAEVSYQTALGDAQVKRAAALGTAEVKLAGERVAAGQRFVSSHNAAESNSGPEGVDFVHGSARRYAIAIAQKSAAIEQAAAARDRVAGEQLAQSGRVAWEGMAAVTAAGHRATAEATYQHTVAQATATRLSTAVTAAGSGVSEDLVYQAAHAAAQAGWIQAVGPSFILHASGTAMHEQYYQPVALAAAWRLHESARANAEYWFTNNVAPVEAARARDDGNAASSYASQSLGVIAGRDLAHAVNSGGLEVKYAKAAKEQAVTAAKVEKAYRLDALEEGQAAGMFFGSVPWDSAAAKERTKALADAGLMQAKAQNLARYEFQKAETTARKTYTQTQAGLDQASAGPAIRAANAARQTADFQLALDAAYATAEESYWLLETATAGQTRILKSTTDATLWTAQEAANVAGAQAIDAGGRKRGQA